MDTGKKLNPKRKKSIAEIGQVVPSNFKFGLIDGWPIQYPLAISP